jgi:hypothetical protein
MKELILTALSLIAFFLLAQMIDLMSPPQRGPPNDVEPVVLVKQGST